MRWLLFCSAALLAVVMLAVACDTADPNACYVNTSGGFGASGPIPIGAGVGVSSGGDLLSPPRLGPLGYPPPANPCVTQGSDSTAPPLPPPAQGCGTAGAALSGDTYVYCDTACMAQCAPMMGTFDSSIFKFVTTLPDDGTDTGGGWQQASNELKFRRWTGVLPETWTCPQITVGMPLRTTATPAITPAYAASITAGIANAATGTLMHPPSGIDPPPGVFCTQLKPAMQQLFDTVYGKLIGAKVSTP